MVKANTTIIVGEKVFQTGQAVNGLSKLDKKWMLEAGYIIETARKKEETAQPAQTEERADGQL